jgi:hypothetical protein
MRLVGANVKATVTGAEELPGKSNYFIGNDPKKWRTNVPSYAKVKYEGVYPGIDLVYYGSQRQLEYDFVVAPGADPNQIKLSFAGAEGIRVDPASGDLVLKVGDDEVRFHKPVVYQPPVAAVYDRHRRSQSAATAELDGAFVVASNNEVAFRVAGYDRKRALVIDPVLSYSTYLGGSGGDYGNGIAVDSSGNAYVTGFTDSNDFPTANPLQGACDDCFYTPGTTDNSGDAFVAKLNPTGSALVYSTYLGGSLNDYGTGIAVDSAGNAYVTGATNSTDFPTANPLQGPCHEVGCAFVAKLNPAGSALVYSTYLGGTGGATGNGIAVDSAGNAYVTGYAGLDFPTVNPFQGTCHVLSSGNCLTAFVATLNPAGSALVYSTYLGGSEFEEGHGIAVDSAGNAYVTGETWSTDFPTANPLQPSLGGSENAFVAKFNPAGSALVYSTYLGGSGYDSGNAIALDSSGNAYVTGSTSSINFPTANPLQPSYGGGASNAFVAQLNPAGNALVYSTYLGSEGAFGSAIAADSAGNAYVAGNADSAFPTVNALQPCRFSGFVAMFSPTGSALVYSTCLGGQSNSGYENASGVAVDASGNAYVTGSTNSFDFVTASPLQPSYGGGPSDAFVAKIVATVTLLPTSLPFPNQMVGTTSPAQPATLSNIGSANLTISSIYIAGSATGDFAVVPDGTTCSASSPLAAGTSCTINVTFSPTIAGSESASLSVGISDSVTPATVALSGTGVLLPAPNVSPTSLSFNNQPVGTTSASRPVTVTNTGALAMSISSLTISSGWTQSNNCLPSIAASASCTINVSFQPTAGGFQTGTVTLTDNATNSPQTVSLSGTGVVPVVSLSATSLSFPAQTVSISSPPQTLTLTNTGNGALTPLTIGTGGDFAQTNTCGGSVAAGAGCTISVTFTPTAAGYRTGTLTLTDNASNSPQTVSLSGTGVVPAVSLSAPYLSFPGQTVSTSSSPQKLLLTNTGAGVLTPLTITTSGDFAQTNTCAGSVAAGASCTISVTFTPTAPGSRTGTLTLTDNASNSPQMVSLSGTGLNPIPTLGTLSPAGATAGGVAFTLTVTGTNYVSGSTVNWNGTALTTTYVSSTQVTASVPAGHIATARTASVTVVNSTPGGGRSNNLIFHVDNPLPNANSLSPTTAMAGGAAFTLTVTGTDFVSGSIVNWNGTGLTTTYLSGTKVTASVPASDIATVGTASVTVINPTPGGGTSSALTFSINNPLPKATSLSPSSAMAGGAALTLTVTGTDFVSGSTVNWNGTGLTTTYVSSTQVTASVPASHIATARTASVTVVNPTPGGGRSNNLIFTVNNPLPKATSLSPSSATAGGAAFTLTVRGTNFVSTSTVQWNGAGLTTKYVSGTKLTASVPASDIKTAGKATVTVMNPTPGGGVSSGLSFTIN